MTVPPVQWALSPAEQTLAAGELLGFIAAFGGTPKVTTSATTPQAPGVVYNLSGPVPSRDTLTKPDEAIILATQTTTTLVAKGNDDLLVGSDAGDRFTLDGKNDTAFGGSGNDTVTVNGADGLVYDGAGNNTAHLFSNDDTVVGGGNDTITVSGNFESIQGSSAGTLDLSGKGSDEAITGAGGGNTISLFGDHNSISVGNANSVIKLTSNSATTGSDFDTVTAGNGDDAITVHGDHDQVSVGTGNDTINVTGNNDNIDPSIAQGSNDTINVTGNFDTIEGGPGNDSITVHGDNNVVDLVGSAMIGLHGSNNILQELSGTFSDTVVGFSASGGDTIALSSADTVAAVYASAKLINNGKDTQLTFAGDNGSTLVLKGVTHIDSSIFVPPPPIVIST